MKFDIRFIRLLTAILLYAGTASAQPMSSAAIDSVALRSMEAFHVPGIAVCVVKDGNVIHSKGYGVRSLRSKLPVDENTLFGIASNSKVFLAVSLGLLVDEGKLSWDDKVRKYIPEFTLYDPYVSEDFRIRDLLTHRSGLGLGAGDLMLFPDGNNFSVNDVIYNLRFLKQSSAFRTKYDYDNNMYIVAGEVVRRISGVPWTEFVETRIMKPLGMDRSAATFNHLRDTSNIIDAHAPVDGVVQVIDRNRNEVMAPAGGINTSISDLSKWILAILGKGSYGGQKLFSEDVYKEITSPQTILRVNDPGPYNTHFAAYGLGLFLADVKGYKQLSHTGGLEGMVTQVTLIPELGLGIIVLTNQQEGGAFASITNQIKDSYLGISGTDRVQEYSQRRGKTLDQNKTMVDSVWNESAKTLKALKGKVDFTPYSGRYADAWLGEINVADTNGKLWFSSKRSPRISGEMVYLKANTFIVKWTDRSMDADAYITFTLDEKGKAVRATMKPVSPLTDFSYDFQDLELQRSP